MKCRLIMSIGHSLLGHIGYKITGHNGGNGFSLLFSITRRATVDRRGPMLAADSRGVTGPGSRSRSPVAVDV